MDKSKIFEHSIALIRANMCLGVKKLLHYKKLDYSIKTRMFARAEIVIRDRGCIKLGLNIKLGKNSALTAQGGNIVIGDGVGINRDVIINAHEQICIGDNTVIAPHVCIYDHDHVFDKEHGVNKRKFKTSPINIGQNVWIGANSVILRGTIIGDNCVVGAGSIIKGEYPEGSIIVQKRVGEVIL